MSLHDTLYLLLVFFIFSKLLSIIRPYFFKEMDKIKEKEETSYDELMRFFCPGEKLTIREVGEKIKKITQGRRKEKIFFLHHALEKLYHQGKLGKEEVKLVFNGEDIYTVVYFLLHK